MSSKVSKSIELFNQHNFFQAHEELEILWQEVQPAQKDLLKGIIHAAIALLLIEQDRLPGASKRYKSSINYLQNFKPYALGINITKLIDDLNVYFKPLQTWDGKSNILFSTEKPKIELE